MVCLAVVGVTVLAVVMVAAACGVCARHIPGGRAVVDGVPPGPPPYTEQYDGNLGPFFDDYRPDSTAGVDR